MYTLEKNEFCKIHLDSLTTTTHIIIRRCVVRLAWMLRKIWRRYENLPLDIMPSMALLLSLQSLNPERYKALPWSYSVTTKIKAAQSHLSYSYYVESGLVTSNVTCTFVCFNKKLATTLNKNLVFHSLFVIIIRIYKKNIFCIPYYVTLFLFLMPFKAKTEKRRAFAHSFRGMSCYVNFVWKPGNWPQKMPGLIIEFGIVVVQGKHYYFAVFFKKKAKMGLLMKNSILFWQGRSNKCFTICWFSVQG